MNWKLVILSLRQAGCDAQDAANRYGALAQADPLELDALDLTPEVRALREAARDVEATILRELANALERGLM